MFGMYVHTGTQAQFAETLVEKALRNESDYACLANVHMLVETRKNASFADTVNKASVIMPDGKPLTWAMRLLYGIRQERVPGMQMLPDVLTLAEKQKVPVFFYGGSEEMLKKASEVMPQKFPDLPIAGMYSPPFRPLTPQEETEVIDRINGSGAKLVVVILGCPKQERWMQSMRGRVQAYMVGLGGAMPVLLGMQKRAPEWMQRYGFEWLHRLVQEPRRLFKRYAVTNSVFLWLLVKALLQKTVLRRRFAAVSISQ